jgi:hypothetical protein
MFPGFYVPHVPAHANPNYRQKAATGEYFCDLWNSFEQPSTRNETEMRKPAVNFQFREHINVNFRVIESVIISITFCDLSGSALSDTEY